MVEVQVGTCGFGGGRAAYFSRFRLVELQEPFYNLPRPATAARWRAAAPLGFTFTLKASQLITHPPSSPTYRRLRRPLSGSERSRLGTFRSTGEVRAVWEATRAVVDALDAAVVVFQCPASFGPTPEHVRRLERFFGDVPRDGRLFAWEPRGSWDDARVRGLCRACDLIHCVDPFQRRPVWGKPAYFRLHGRSGYRTRYADADLDALTEIVRQQPRGAFVLFNNIEMLGDAERFAERLAA